MKLILTRHGETIENQKGIMQRHLPGTLSGEGIKQAKKLALRLKDEKIDAVYCSDLRRAADTAKEILKYHDGIKVYYVTELREGDLGPYTGKLRSSVDFKSRPKEMEPMESMQRRAENILDAAYKRYPEGIVLFVGHSGINKALISVIMEIPVGKVENPENTSVSIFDINEDRKHKVHLINCVKHLD